MSDRLTGKTAVVTGGTTGIGLATAKRFAEEDARVFITGRRRPELDAAVKKIGKNAVGVQGDVANLSDLDKLYATVKEQAGSIDVLFANAGSGEYLALGSITEEHFDKTFASNVKGLVFTVQKALPLFRDGGSIILNASVAASKGFESFSVYAATKAAVRSFARSWTSDLKARRIRVNAISPGPIDTPLLRGIAEKGEATKDFFDGLVASVPLGRIGTPDDIANAALFLATNESSFVSGIELFVDGGIAQV